jgi:hypothetical protein
MLHPLFIAFLVLLFPLAFAALWCGICFMLALVSGWRRLALTYATDQAPHGSAFGWQNGYVGLVAYRNCLNVHVASEGLFLSTPWLFRLGHKTLFFPWSAIHDIQASEVLWLKLTRFEVGTPSLAHLQLPTRVFEARHDGAQ